VLGTTYTQALRVSGAAVAGAVGVGALACAILVANNLRDVPTDAAAGKRTLAVRIGARATRLLYGGLLALCAVATVAVAATGRPWALLALASFALAVGPLRTVLRGASGRALVVVLRDTGRLELAYAVLLSVGLVVG
jgi:1,4-dihydroxy-2-naphthoate octaprenyltransferase